MLEVLNAAELSALVARVFIPNPEDGRRTEAASPERGSCRHSRFPTLQKAG